MRERAAIELRPAEDRDLPALAALLSASTGMATTVAQVEARRLRSREIEHPIVALIDAHVVGFASVRLTHSLGEDRRYAEVLELFVEPQHRQRGIGAALLAELRRMAHASGALGWSVLVDPDNAAAMALYRKQGFGTFAVAMQQWFSEERPFKLPPK